MPSGTGFSHSLHLQVGDVDTTVQRAAANGATIVTPMVGIGGGASEYEAQLGYKVSDIANAAARVRDHGGHAGEPTQRPYGLLAECTDDQGISFQLWQPTG